MQKVEGSSPFSRFFEHPAIGEFWALQERLKARIRGLFCVSRRFRDGNSALGEHIVGFRQVAAEHPLQQLDRVIGVVEVVLVDVSRGARVLVAHELAYVASFLGGLQPDALRALI